MRSQQLTDLLKSLNTSEIVHRYTSLPANLQQELFQEAMRSNERRENFKQNSKGDEKNGRLSVVFRYLDNGGPALAFPPIELLGMTSDKLAIPNIFSNSGLFAVQASNVMNRDVLNDYEIYSRDGCSILFSGERLYQSDQDLLLILKNRSREGLGKVYSIHYNEILIQLGLKVGGDNYLRIRESLKRLRKSALSIETKSYRIGKDEEKFHLINFYRIDGETKRIFFSTRPKVQIFF